MRWIWMRYLLRHRISTTFRRVAPLNRARRMDIFLWRLRHNRLPVREESVWVTTKCLTKMIPWSTHHNARRYGVDVYPLLLDVSWVNTPWLNEQSCSTTLILRAGNPTLPILINISICPHHMISQHQILSLFLHQDRFRRILCVIRNTLCGISSSSFSTTNSDSSSISTSYSSR